jgi:hypothetical protein
VVLEVIKSILPDEVPGTFLDKPGYDFCPAKLGTSLLNLKCQVPSVARKSAFIFDILIPAFNGGGKIEKRISNQEWRLFIPAARNQECFLCGYSNFRFRNKQTKDFRWKN